MEYRKLTFHFNATQKPHFPVIILCPSCTEQTDTMLTRLLTVIVTCRFWLHVSEVGSDGLSVGSNDESTQQTRTESLLNATRRRNHISLEQSSSTYKCDDSVTRAPQLKYVTTSKKIREYRKTRGISRDSASAQKG
jgi:hypothetical protein